MSKYREIERALQNVEKWVLIIKAGLELEESALNEDAIVSDLEKARDFLCRVNNSIAGYPEVRRDPSDGIFVAQEPDDDDGFCDCPECCGE